MADSNTSILMTAAVFLLLVLLILRRMTCKRYHLPPGPFGLPIVGYLPWLDPKTPHVTLTRLSRKYGAICGLKMGSVYTVLLSDPRLVRQALAKDSCTGRAPLYLTHGIMKGYGIICAEGDLWRDQRKFIAGCLRNFGMVKFRPKRDKLERKITEAADDCVSKLRERSREEALDPLPTLHHCIGNFINDLVFGKTYEEDDEVWAWLRHLQEEGVKHIGIAGPINFFPFLRFLPRYGETMRSLVDGKIKTHEIYQSIIDEHRKLEEKSESFLAAFDDEMTNAKMGSDDARHFTQTQFYHLLADLFGAGTDTTLTTFRWFLLFMAAYPQEQKKIREEMQHVLGDREATLDDRSDLARLEAAIAEVQRLRSVVPLGIPHGTVEDTRIDNYDIPKGTMVVPLLWAIHTDPTYWTDPMEFKPERFIAEDGSLAKPEAFLPFQTGKRMCVGDELARMVLFLFAARILRHLVVLPPENEQVDTEGECGITLVPKPHRLRFIPQNCAA